MTGSFSKPDPQICAHYARFMEHLTISEANAIFWLLFGAVIIFMYISAAQHNKSHRFTAEEAKLSESEKDLERHRRAAYRRRRGYLAVASLCFIFAITCVILECFALLHIQYCEGEDLIQLYWGFWSITQVGSLIAIGGVMIQLCIVMVRIEMPSWGVALSTPVLVFAALGWVFISLWKRAWARFQGQNYDDMEDKSEDLESDTKWDGLGYRISQALIQRTILDNLVEAPRCETSYNTKATSAK